MFPYYLLTFFARLCRWVPFGVGYWLGDKLGGFAFAALPGPRRATLFNIRLAFPDKDEAWVRRVGREAYGNMGKVAFEFFRFHATPKKVALERVVFEDPRMVDAMKGKPLLIGASHSGGWDLGGIAMSALGFDLAVVVAAMRQPGVERFIRENRAEKLTLIYRDPGVRSTCLNRLKQGGQLVLTPDQRFGSRGVDIQFFGHPCGAPRGPAEFSLETGLPLIAMFPYRMGDNRVGIRMGKPIDPGDYPGEDAVVAITQEWNTQLEAFIRDYPGSYFWMHRRWKGTVAGA